MTRFCDKLTLDGVRRTQDGYLVAEVRAARTGIQLYSGRDVGMPEKKVVRVYRPEDSVFNKDSLASFAFRPVTVGHPPDGVDSTNWKDLARGITGGDIARDGDYVRVPLAIMDEAAIKAVEDGMREISMGYDAILEFVDGVTPNGEQYDAIQTQQRMNHLALVTTARGGSNLRIGDNEGEPRMANRTILVDGLSVETTDQGAQAIEKLLRDRQTLQDKLATDIAAKDKRIGELTADVAKKDGELAVAKQQIADATLTPAKLDAAVLARTSLIDDARKIAGDAVVVDGKTDVEIRRAAVAARLGDEATKAMSDAALEGAFAALAKSAVADTAPAHSSLQPLRTALGSLQSQDGATAADKAHDAYVKRLADGWKTPEPRAN